MPPGTGTAICTHTNLTFTTSSHASKAGYIRPTLAQLQAATTSQRLVSKSSTTSERKGVKSSTFPAPLVLPGDELSCDPEYPAQSVKDWIGEKDRNEVTEERKVVYVVPPPGYVMETRSVARWTFPVSKGHEETVEWTSKETENVLEYLRAFYHGMEVRMLPQFLFFTSGGEDDEPRQKGGKKSGRRKKDTKSPVLWVDQADPSTSTTLLGVRTRATPGGVFSHQLNLNDLLEAAIEILPEDAYALLMLVQHDIFEDEEDDFACGRAYGGSRVAVVSTARYDPVLDGVQKVSRSHGWPASHCETYVKQCIEEAAEDENRERRRKKKKLKRTVEKEEEIGMGDSASPMNMALAAHTSLPSLYDSPSKAALSGLMLGRVCRTASHELGHCFGIDHCVYYACCMQGTASVVEDARQPPYLCPVDLVKVLKATGADERERYKALETFCSRFEEVHLFAAFGAWLRGRIGELDGLR